MRRSIAVAFAVVVSLINSPARAEVLIGLAAPITGQLAWIGEQVERGADSAVGEINASGGVLGEQVRLVVADDFCDASQAVVAAEKLITDGVVFVVGHMCSEAAIPASKVYSETGIVAISPTSTNPRLTEQGYSNIFRTIGRDDQQGKVAGDYLADHWADRKIAIFNDGTTYGRGLAEETKKQLNFRGVTEASFRTYSPEKDDYSEEIDALEAAGVSVLYLGGRHRAAALMARTAYDRNYSVQLVSGDTLATEEFGLIAGPAADGTLFTFGADPRQNPEAASVVERFRAEGFEPTGYTLLSYAAVQAWAQAVGKANSLDAPAVSAALHGDQFDTVLGAIDFDAKGDLTIQNWVWYVWRNGEYVQLDR